MLVFPRWHWVRPIDLRGNRNCLTLKGVPVWDTVRLASGCYPQPLPIYSRAKVSGVVSLLC